MTESTEKPVDRKTKPLPEGASPEETIPEQTIVVGKINGAYGIKGWVKVYSFTEPLDQILDYQPWILKRGRKLQSLKISQGKPHGKGIIALPEGFDNRNQAEEILGSEILIDKAQLPDLDDGDFYWSELEGLQVINEEDEVLGVVSHLFETGANDVMVVKPCDGSIDDKERLIPYVEVEVVTDIDLAEGQIRVIWQKDY